MSKKEKVILISLLGIILLAITINYFIPTGTRISASFQIDYHCRGNLDQIYAALQTYSEKYNDNYPPYDGAQGLDLLRQEGLVKYMDFFICPGTKISANSNAVPLDEEHLSYCYKGGYVYGKTPGNAPFIWDKQKCHEGKLQIRYFNSYHVEKTDNFPVLDKK